MEKLAAFTRSAPCLLLVLAIVSGDILTDMKYIKQCNSTSPVTMQTLNEILISKKIFGTQSANFKCFLHCLFGKYGWMDDEGGFLLHQMRHVLEDVSLDASIVEYVMYTCTALKSVDKCERAALFLECFWLKSTEETDEKDKFFYSLDDGTK